MMKLNLISEYVLSCNNFILFILTLEFVEFVVVLIGLLCFGLMYYNHSIIAKFKYHFKQLSIFINKYNKQSSWTPKSSESFVWKDTNWKHIELRLSILQNKIYAARKI